MSRVLVTGATGFAGRSVGPALAAKGHEVIAPPDRLPLGQSDAWAGHLEGVSSLVHLAGRAHITAATADADTLFFETNTTATLALARLAAEAGVSHFVFASTAKVYGPASAAAGARETDTPEPGDAYARSKLAAEEGLAEISAQTGMGVTIFRLPLCYGPGVKARMLSLFRLVDRRLPLPLGAINSRRSYLGIDNLADAIAVCVQNSNSTREPPRIYNIGEAITPTLVQLLHEIGAALEVPVRLFSIPSALLRASGQLIGKSVEIDRLLSPLVLDTTALSATGWVPPVTLEAGLARTAAWYRNQSQFSQR